MTISSALKLLENLQKIKGNKNFQPIDIVFKPVTKINQTINCYLSKLMRNSYRVLSNLKKDKDVTSADQCFPCNKYFI